MIKTRIITILTYVFFNSYDFIIKSIISQSNKLNDTGIKLYVLYKQIFSNLQGIYTKKKEKHDKISIYI